MPRPFRVKARIVTKVHEFREYVDEDNQPASVSLCGIRTAPDGIELVDTFTPTTCRICAERE